MSLSGSDPRPLELFGLGTCRLEVDAPPVNPTKTLLKERRVSIQTCLAFLSEVGTGVGKFASAGHFASWLGLCPDNRITGGRTHAAHTRKVNNRLANTLRMAAQSLHRSQSVLGDWFRRLKSKLGAKAAITGAAHKLARVLYAMIRHRRPYEPNRLGNPDLRRARKERYLRRQAAELGFVLTPNGEVS